MIKKSAYRGHNKSVEKLIFDLMWLFDITQAEAEQMVRDFGIEYLVKLVEKEKQNV